MTGHRKTRFRIIALALGAAGLLVPLTFSGGGVRPNDACAAGLCCLEPGSLCDKSGEVQFDHVYINGVCPDVPR